jgi:hypothetical protein
MIIRTAILAALFLLLPSQVRSQTLEIVTMGGWQFGGKVDVRQEAIGEEGELRLPAAWAYGLTLDLRVRSDGQVELIYYRQDTELELKTPFPGTTDRLFDMAVEYLHVGGLYEVQHGAWYPFAIASLGATHLKPRESGISDEWKFSGALGGGAKIYVSELLGFRAQGRLWMTLIESNSSFFCVLPGGCVVSVAGTVMFQGEVSAGIVLAF